MRLTIKGRGERTSNHLAAEACALQLIEVFVRPSSDVAAQRNGEERDSHYSSAISTTKDCERHL